MTSDAEKLAQTIQALEAQRQVLGSAVVDAALAPLREKLAALQNSSLGEQRKIVTILFADLVGFTAMAAQLDPEDVREIINAYFQRWAGCITRYEGVLEKFIGDAVLAVFGLPGAHEDDPERAIRAALEMQKELKSFNHDLERERGLRLVMRVGINTGEVVVSLLGERQGEDFVVVGDVVNLTSRLQSAAPEDSILITHDTYRHVRGVFEVASHGPLALKGVSQPVAAYWVKAAKPRAFRLESRGVKGADAPLVGRQKEIDLLEEAFRRVVKSRVGHVVTLVGEAGMGKSRLLYEFENWVDLRPERVYYFRGRAHAASQNAPYSLLRDVIAFRCQVQDSDPPADVREKLESGIAEVMPDDPARVAQAHLIARLVGFEIGESEHLRPFEGDAKALHDRALQALGGYFRAVGQRGPALVLLEDLHWADNASLELFPHLEALLAQHPFFFLCTARPVFFERFSHWGEELTNHTRRDLTPLPPVESTVLAEALLKKIDPLPAALRTLVVATAEGNPFFMEELIQMLIDDGVIDATGERWQVDEQRLGEAQVPPTLMGVLQARLDSLPPDQRGTLQRAAVIGRIFWDQAVAALAAVNAPDPPHPVPELVFDQLRRRELVFRNERSTFEATTEYQFKHALLRDVSYAGLLKRQRRAYHNLAARWLEEMTARTHRSAEFSTLIAEHHEQAGNLNDSAEWYLRAGREAAARFANNEAMHALARALELSPGADAAWKFSVWLEREKVDGLLGRLDDRRGDLAALEREAGNSGDPALAAQAVMRQAQYAFETSDFPTALEHARRVQSLMERQAPVENTEWFLAQSAVLQAQALNRQGELEEARRQARRAVDLSALKGLPAVEAEAHRQLGLVDYYQGRPLDAQANFSKALELYRAAGDRRGEASALNNLGGATFNAGDYDQAGRYYQQSLELCREIGDLSGQGRAFNNLGIWAITQNNFDLAETYYLQGLAISREVGNRSFEMSALDNLGNLASYRYRYSLALEYQHDALQGANEMGDRLTMGFCLINLGRVYLNLGLYETASRYLVEALHLHEQFEDRQGWSHALANLGLCALLMNDPERGLAYIRQALELSSSEELRSEYAWAAQMYGHILYQLGQYQDALASYREALQIREDLEETAETVDTLAGIAQCLNALEDLTKAVQIVERILTHFDQHGREGYDQPILIYLTCARVLSAVQDPRAPVILQQGRDLLNTIAAQITDDTHRQSYLENVPENIAISGSMP